MCPPEGAGGGGGEGVLERWRQMGEARERPNELQEGAKKGRMSDTKKRGKEKNPPVCFFFQVGWGFLFPATTGVEHGGFYKTGHHTCCPLQYTLFFFFLLEGVRSFETASPV